MANVVVVGAQWGDITLTPGIPHDVQGARNLQAIALTPRRLIADRASDATRLRDWLRRRSVEPVFPPSPTRRHIHADDVQAYKGRNLIERVFRQLKNFHRIATRYDKLARNLLCRSQIAAAVIWWLNCTVTRPGCRFEHAAAGVFPWSVAVFPLRFVPGCNCSTKPTR